MEDWNMLGADCVVISCCCQCLILQILLFVLLKLPYNLVRKTRRFVKRKICGRRKRNHNKRVNREMMGSSYKDVLVRIHEQSIRLEAEMMMDLRDGSGKNCGSCMDEVEKVMEEFYENEDLAFGSFWGKKGPWGVPTPIVTHDHHNYGDDFVRYQIIDLVASST